MTEALQRSEIDKYLLGMTLLVATVFGGGTQPGLPTDTAVQLLSITTASIVCLRHMDRPIDRRVFWFIVAVGLAIGLQIVPFGWDWARSTQRILNDVDMPPGMRPVTISLGLGRSIEAAGYFLTVSLFLVAVLKLRFDQVYGLMAFYLAGLVLNLVAGLIQYSYSGHALVIDVFPYALRAGFFVNENHYSSLLFTSIPIAFVYFIERNRLLYLLAYVVATLLVLLAAGSAAGVIVGFAITALSVVFLFQHSRIGLVAVLFGTLAMGIYSVGLWARLQLENVGFGYGRVEFARTTLEGILDNLPFGIGYGNFVIAYPSYEKSSMILDTYVNHAHNDYLELIFEGGLLAAMLMVAFFVLLAGRIWQTLKWPLHKAATLAIVFLLIHSVVDYPLRTLALAFSFALFLGVLFHRGSEKPDPSSAVVARVNLDGEMISVPLKSQYD